MGDGRAGYVKPDDPWCDEFIDYIDTRYGGRVELQQFLKDMNWKGIDTPWGPGLRWTYDFDKDQKFYITTKKIVDKNKIPGII